MTNREAKAFNVLMRWLLQDPLDGLPVPSEFRARTCAEYLAQNASDTLCAEESYDAESLERKWIERARRLELCREAS